VRDRLFRYIGGAVAGLAVLVMTVWASLAVYYSNLPGRLLRASAACLFAGAATAVFLFVPRRRRALAAFLVGFAALTVWWLSIPASNDRDWQNDVAVLPYATVHGDRITVHNIRNLAYRTETDFDARYYDKTVDLNKLDSVDLIAVYWMGDAIAHIMISFGFEEKDFIVFSIETRKERGEGYSTVKGFFKQYELIYVVGDERDLIRVRTDYRNPREDVYLYRLRTEPKARKRFFMEYIRQINAMRVKAVWYNTLTTNCTTNVVHHVRALGGRAQYTWKVLLSGYAPEYAYELGVLDNAVPFPELRRRSYINDRAHRVGDDPAFSVKIREGLPVPGPGGQPR
jgi:hypothetical protein